MTVLEPLNAVVERGIALHKLIRLVVHGLGGEGYLNFIGNEFGHPEWLDFPRAGNNESYHHARRQWNLVDDQNLFYKYMNEFDKAMNMLEEKFNWLNTEMKFAAERYHEDDKTICFERAGLIFCFNFHPLKSHTDHWVGIDFAGEYKIVLDSDWPEFGGFNRRDRNITSHSFREEHVGKRCHIKTYLPCRTAVVFERVGSSANMEDLPPLEENLKNNVENTSSSLQSCEALGTKSEMNLNEEIPVHFL